MTKENGPYLAKRLMTRIGSLIDGNNASASDIIETDIRSDACTVTFDVNWSFYAHTTARSIAGNAAVKGAHYAHDKAAFDRELKRRKDESSYNENLRVPFQERVKQEKANALSWSAAEQTAWDFGEHSSYRYCNQCNGNGTVQCQCCWGTGKTRCIHCHGVGHREQSRTVMQGNHHVTQYYKQSCNHCYSSGNVTCAHCRGNGRQTCGSCNGHGYFTDLIHTIAIAKPALSIQTRTNLSSQKLCDYLCSVGCASASTFLDFKLINTGNSEKYAWKAVYECKTTVIENDFSIQRKNYMCAAVGDIPMPFVRPAVFDDLFETILVDIQATRTENNHAQARKNKAGLRFEQYRRLPILDRGLKEVAKLSGAQRMKPGQAIVNTCDGFITSTAAEALGNNMTNLLDVISPANSKWSWGIVMAIPLIITFFLTENVFESSVTPLWWAPLSFIYCIVVSALYIILISPLAWLPSSIISAIRRRAIPKEYRQRARNWEPLKLILQIASSAVFFGCIYGVIARYDYFPKWNNAPVIFAENYYVDHRPIITRTLDSALTALPWMSDEKKSEIRINWPIFQNVNFKPTLTRQSPFASDCAQLWLNYEHLPEGIDKKQKLSFYTSIFGAMNFHQGCLNSLYARQCEIEKKFHVLKSGYEKERLSKILHDKIWASTNFQAAYCLIK